MSEQTSLLYIHLFPRKIVAKHFHLCRECSGLAFLFPTQQPFVRAAGGRCWLRGTIHAVVCCGSQAWPRGAAGFGLGYVVAEKTIKKKSSESALWGRGRRSPKRRRETVFEVLFLVPVSRCALAVWIMLVTRVIFPQERSQPQTIVGPPSWSLSTPVLSVQPGVLFHRGLGVGRESSRAANAQQRLVLHPWPGAPRVPPPSRAGWLLDGGQPEIIGANTWNARWKTHSGCVASPLRGSFSASQIGRCLETHPASGSERIAYPCFLNS